MILNILDIMQMIVTHRGEAYIASPTTAFLMLDDGTAYVVLGDGFDTMSPVEFNQYIQMAAANQA